MGLATWLTNKMIDSVKPSRRDVTITVYSTYATVTNWEAIKELMGVLCYYDPNYPDGWRPVIDGTGVMAPGLVKRAVEHLRQPHQRYNVVVKDLTGEPKATLAPTTVPLRDYQIPAVEAMIRSKRGMLFAAPGAGKTAMAAAILQRLHYARPALFLVQSDELRRQAQEALSNWLGAKVGTIGGGERIKSECGVYVVSLQTFTHGMDRFHDLIGGTRLVIIDEAHHAGADTYCDVLNQLRSVWRVYGLSGTPWRGSDDKGIVIEGNVGPIQHAITYDDLIDLGYLTPPINIWAQMPEVPKRVRLSDTAANWKDVYDERIINNDVRNHCIRSFSQWLAREVGWPTIITVDRLEHGRRLASDLGCPFTEGGSGLSHRKKVLSDLREGRINLAVSTLYREAVDIPRLVGVVNAAAGKSSTKFYQMMRHLRVCEGNPPVCLTLDFLDTGTWVDQHSQDRLRLAKTPKRFENVTVEYWSEDIPARTNEELWGWLRPRLKAT